MRVKEDDPAVWQKSLLVSTIVKEGKRNLTIIVYIIKLFLSRVNSF